MKSNRSTYKFNVDILIQGDSNAAALEKLLNLLQNEQDILDLQVQSGTQLGTLVQLMEMMQQQNIEETPFGLRNGSSDTTVDATTVDENQQQAPKKKQAQQPLHLSGGLHELSDVEKQIEQFILHKSLIRMFINKGKGVKISMPCRVLNYDAEKQLLNVYHVDEKQVYAFHLFEIEEMNA
ncbi:hypothetical protein [Paenibacillus sp. 481]|uniref:hypothetical protein n=1 Tax=Paenibacillus sp. 481 TaxID=2835869 RepID=UPI001E625EDA|nr:hypothetical protein [Paenibacillus sp. 481]